MFMQNNRAKNGAAQPEAVARADAAGQRAAESLNVNEPLAPPQQRTFEPKLPSLKSISRSHVRGGLDEGGKSGPYTNKIPCGPKMP